jgi:uncharacterized membrane protein
MEKFVNVVFENETDAFRGADALRSLHRKGDLTVYSAAVVSRRADGSIDVKNAKDEGPIGTFFGLGLGALIGLMAGPAAVATGAAAAGTAAAQIAATGLTLGGATGGLLGLFRDVRVMDVDANYADSATRLLDPGQVCLIASVDEYWTAPLDTVMGDLGGKVGRNLRNDVVDEQILAERKLLQQEREELSRELKETHDANKAAIREKIESVKEKIADNTRRIEDRLDEIDAEFDARIDAIDTQITQANDRRKQRLADRKAELKAEHEARRTRLMNDISVAEAVLAA